MAVDEVVVRAQLKDDLSGPLKGVRREVERFERDVTKAGRASVIASRTFTGMGSQLGALSRQVGFASVSLAQLAGQATRTASVGLGALGVAATGFGLNAEAGFERSRIAFGTLLEDVEGGNRLFAELQSFNLKTPFELGEISAATQTLLQFDVAGGDVMQTLKSISDIAATTSAPGENLNRIALALGQINSAGVLRGQDLNQLVQAGFPAYQLLTQITGQTTAQLRQQMETGLTLPAEDFIAALNEGGGVLAKFASGAEMQSQTLSGVFSNLKDTVQTQLAEAFRPLAEGLSQTLPGFSAQLGDFISKVAPPLSRLGMVLLDGVGRLLPIIEPPLTALLTGIGTLAEAALPAFQGLQPVMADLGLAFGDLVAGLVPVLPELVGAFIAVAALLPDILRLASQLLPVLEPVALVVKTIAEALGWVLDKLGGAVPSLMTPGADVFGDLPPGTQPFGGGTDVASLTAYNLSRLPALPGQPSPLGMSPLAAPAAAGSAVTAPSLTSPAVQRFAAAPGVPAGVSGTVTNNVNVTVNNPAAEIDVTRAVNAAMREQYESWRRRGDTTSWQPSGGPAYYPTGGSASRFAGGGGRSGQRA